MKKVFIDTNIFINYLRGADKELLELFRFQLEGKVKLLTSSAVVFEIYSGQSLIEKKIKEKIDKLFTRITVEDVTQEIAKLAAEINRKNKLYRKVETNDLLIAASAIYFQAELLTKNSKHFELIPGLKLFEF